MPLICSLTKYKIILKLNKKDRNVEKSLFIGNIVKYIIRQRPGFRLKILVVSKMSVDYDCEVKWEYNVLNYFREQLMLHFA